MIASIRRPTYVKHLDFDLWGISDLRGHEADVLKEGYCELDPESLVTMRKVYGFNDKKAQAQVDYYEKRIIYGSSPNRPRLYAETLASTLALIRMSKPQSVLDLGCGDEVGILTRALVRERYLKRIIGVNIDERHIRVNKALLPKTPLPHRPTIEMYQLDMTVAADRKIIGDVDCITLVEVIEHIKDKTWISNIFALNPSLLIVTTPNRDFNTIYPPMLLCDNGLRDPDHKYEFSQQEFFDWAHLYAKRYGYTVDILPLGPANIIYGPAGLQAVFQKDPFSLNSIKNNPSLIKKSSIISKAIDPLQYDSSEVHWEQEGSPTSPNRRLFLEYLRPVLKKQEMKRVIDIGCGHGWLCDEISRFGGIPLGLDPSIRCFKRTRLLYPDLELCRSSLQEFRTNEKFDTAFVIMVENFLNLDLLFKKIHKLLKPGGKLIIIASDFKRSTNELDHKVEKEIIDKDTVALRIESPNRFGVLCDIIHRIRSYKEAAKNTGLTLEQHTKILPRKRHPRYKSHRGKALFHLLEFRK
ncbi:MAG TPA: class I SAM-dependent methyltransferase [Candidatus Saccharimonadales bacterium]|nr:class I SAM-dependent methyltransferase [Candidatus Saccharimonadales bacterium]